MKKVLLGVSCVVLSAAFLISCTSTSQTMTDRNKMQRAGKIRLRFMSSWGGVDSKAGTLQEVLTAFMESHRDIEVVNESLFGEDFLPKIKTDFASGNDPDVFGFWPGSDIRALVKAGKVADLTDLLESNDAWKNSFGNMWDYTTFNGRIYGLPVEIIFECLFINTDIFERYDVAIPQNYDELKQAIAVFKDKGIIPIAYNSLAEGTFLYQNIVAMLGSKEEVENPFKDGKVSPCYIEAMKYMRELYQIGAFPQDAFILTNNERNVLFMDKKAAMIAQGSWFIGYFNDDTDDTVDIIPFPAIKPGKSDPATLIYGLGCGVFHISSSAWADEVRREASVKLLKWLTSSNTAQLFARRTGMISNVDTSWMDIRYSRLTQKGLEIINNARVLVGPPDSYVDRSLWEGEIVKSFPYVLEGRTAPEEVWDMVLEKQLKYPD